MNRFLCRPWGIILSVLVLVGLDQWTKALAVRFLKGAEPFVIWNGVFELRYLENRGAAFGLFQAGVTMQGTFHDIVNNLTLHIERQLTEQETE